PLGAIFYDTPGKPFVFLRSPSGWERRDVQLGLANHVEVALHSDIETDSVIALERPLNQKQ
ncbi:MAG: hypothetical protein M3Z36_12600, partial [Acidobacteriota bacterium]|nr:hypothetical protein [Acidobacteriota bacterium]